MINKNQIEIRIDPMLRPMPVILCDIENSAVKTGLCMDKCGDNGRLSSILF